MHPRTKVQLLVVPLFCLIVVPIILFNEPLASPPCICPQPCEPSAEQVTTVPPPNSTSRNESRSPIPETVTVSDSGSRNESYPVPSINESAVQQLEEKPLLVVTKIRWINRENGSTDEERV